eukprot:m.223515 g.223515  ORF g.223515 m.223515 type:complete len:54 (+) comp16265_c0_seq1:823-984(+)
MWRELVFFVWLLLCSSVPLFSCASLFSLPHDDSEASFSPLSSLSLVFLFCNRL